MKFLRNLGKRIPKWMRPSPETATQGKAVLKAFAKGVVIAGAGLISEKSGNPVLVTGAIAGSVHALIKWIDPTDTQFGVNAA